MSQSVLVADRALRPFSRRRTAAFKSVPTLRRAEDAVIRPKHKIKFCTCPNDAPNMATLTLVKEAIVSLKDRTGSSSIAISKWIETEKKVELKKHLLKAALKRGVDSGTLVMVKNSYKVSAEAKKAKPAPKKAVVAKATDEKKKTTAKKATASKKKTTAATAKKAAKTPAAKKVTKAKKPKAATSAKKASAKAKSPKKAAATKEKKPKKVAAKQ